MGKCSEAFVALDTAKLKHSVAIADGGRNGEVRFLGEVASSPAIVARLIGKLAGRYQKLHVCYEAGPTGMACIDSCGSWVAIARWWRRR